MLKSKMSRKKKTIRKYPVKNSYKYYNRYKNNIDLSEIVSKFIRITMQHGKFSLAENIVFEAIEILIKKSQSQELEINDAEDDLLYEQNVLMKTLNNIRVKKRIQKFDSHGQTFQVPQDVEPYQQITRGIKILVNEARRLVREKGTSIINTLGQLLFDSLLEKGIVIERIHEIEKVAESNRIYAQHGRKRG